MNPQASNDRDTLIKKNFIKIAITETIYTVTNMFTSGAIIQSLLMMLGFSENEVYVYSSVAQLGQVAVMLFMIFYASRIVRVKRYYAIFSMAMILPALLFILGVAFPDLVSTGYVITVYIVTLISSFGVGVRSILSYSVPCMTVGIENFGKYTGVSTASAGAASFASSFLHTFLASVADYKLITAIACGVSIVMMIISSLLIVSLGFLDESTDVTDAKEKVDVAAVFKNRDTYILLLPNIARGLATGVTSVITVIAVTNSLMQAEETSVVNIVLQASLFFANVMFAALYKKCSTRGMISVCTAVMCVTLPLCLLYGKIGFFVFFFIALTARYVIDSAIPTLVVEVMPPSQLGAYTSIRMLLLVGSGAVATLLITPIVSLVGYVGLLIFASVMQLICGAGHVLVSLLHKNDKAAKRTV